MLKRVIVIIKYCVTVQSIAKDEGDWAELVISEKLVRLTKNTSVSLATSFINQSLCICPYLSFTPRENSQILIAPDIVPEDVFE